MFYLRSISRNCERVHPHPNQASNYFDMIPRLNLGNINFPVTLSQIPKFEKQNNISINVFGFEEEVFPLYKTKERG